MLKQRLLWGLVLTILILGGCGIKPKEPPEVFAKMVQTMSKLEKAEFSGEFKLVGKSTVPLLQGLQDLQITGTGRVNLADAKNMKYLLNLLISGMSSEGKTEIGTELRSFPDCNYFRITSITLPLGLPFSLAADNKWYQIKSSGQNKDWLGSTQPLENAQLQLIRSLIAQSQLFNVVQKFPDETVNGARVYHWQVDLSRDPLRQFLRDWVNITNLSDSTDIEHWETMLSGYTYEFWISKSDYRLMRASIKGWYDSQDHQRMDFTVKMTLNKLNTAVAIDQPTNVQEFNLRQLLGLPVANSAQ